MQQSSGHFEAPKGGQVFWRYWQIENCKAVIVLVHGLGEHCGRYEHVAAACNAAGYSVAALDHLGHGQSDGAKGHIDRFAQFTDTLATFVDQVKADFSMPICILGHSMGGLVSCNYLLGCQDKVTCCALSAAALASDIEPGPVQMTLVKFLSAVAPKLRLLQLDANGVSRDKAEVKKYLDDPLVYNGKGTVRLVKELFSAMDRVMDNAAKLTLPILAMHGTGDVMADPNGSRALIEKVGSEDKTLKLYDGLYHEIFNEPEQEQVIADMLAWFDAHIDGCT